MKRFWILWSPQSNLPPRKRWDKKAEAVLVAEKMAINYPDQEFYVLKAEAHSSRYFQPVKTTYIK